MAKCSLAAWMNASKTFQIGKAHGYERWNNIPNLFLRKRKQRERNQRKKVTNIFIKNRLLKMVFQA